MGFSLEAQLKQGFCRMFDWFIPDIRTKNQEEGINRKSPLTAGFSMLRLYFPFRYPSRKLRLYSAKRSSSMAVRISFIMFR
jgi:hypothetical protein